MPLPGVLIRLISAGGCPRSETWRGKERGKETEHIDRNWEQEGCVGTLSAYGAASVGLAPRGPGCTMQG